MNKLKIEWIYDIKKRWINGYKLIKLVFSYVISSNFFYCNVVFDFCIGF